MGGGLVGAHATEALEGFLEAAERSSASHRFPGAYAVDWDEVYESMPDTSARVIL